MATAFLLWSSTTSSSHEMSVDESGSGSPSNRLPILDPEPKEAPTARPRPTPTPTPKAKRNNKAKRQPQRGLGVAQLERLRLQERWKKITDADQIPVQHPPIYDPTLSPLVPKYPGGAWMQTAPPGFCYLPRCQQVAVPPGNLMGYGSPFAVRSVLHEQYSMDRHRVASGEVVIQGGSAYPELPSNQNTPCLSDHCDFCARKRPLYGGENSALCGGNGLDMDINNAINPVDQEAKEMGYRSMVGKSAMRTGTELKEYDFFPHSSRSTDDEDSEFADRTVGDPHAPNFIDLSLTL